MMYANLYHIHIIKYVLNCIYVPTLKMDFKQNK